MSIEFEFLDDSFSDTVDVWRYDEGARSLEGIKTARTILASRMGVSASFGFFDEDVLLHLLSNYQQRLDQPSRTASGIGSPFISGMLRPEKIVGDWIRKRPESINAFLYRISVPRSRLIVPTQDNNTSQSDWREKSLEVLVVGDIDRDSIQEAKIDTAARSCLIMAITSSIVVSPDQALCKSRVFF